MIVIKSTIHETLVSMGEEAYREFSSNLMPAVEKIRVIGIRIPVLRKYAKELENYEEFLGELPHEYFEENNLHAFLIEREKNFERCIEKIDAFLPYIENNVLDTWTHNKTIQKAVESLRISKEQKQYLKTLKNSSK